MIEILLLAHCNSCLIKNYLTSGENVGATDIGTGMPREDVITCLTTIGCELLGILMFRPGFTTGPFRILKLNYKINNQ